MNPFTSVIVPTLGRVDSLRELVLALTRQDDQDFEVIVIADGPAPLEPLDGIGAATVRVVQHADREGPAAARNTGARQARGVLLLFLDDDMIPDAAYVSAHRRFHETSGGRWVACATIVETFVHDPQTFFERALRSERFPGEEHDLLNSSAHAVSPEFYCGNACSIRRADYLRVGGQDPDFSFAEDLELGTRLYLDGFQFARLPGVRAVHRNDKRLEKEFPLESRALARAQIRCVLEKEQAFPHHSSLISRWERRRWSRMIESCVEFAPDASSLLEQLCRIAGNATNSKFLLRAWKRIVRSQARALEFADPAVAARISALAGSPRTILALHSVDEIRNRSDAQHGISSERFRSLLRQLTRRDAALTRVSDGPTAGRHRIALTFDDGYNDFLKVALPILREFDAPATLYVVAGLLGQTNKWDAGTAYRQRPLLTRAQVREIHQAGIEIGCHSMTHAHLPLLGSRELRREIGDARALLEDVIGAEVTSFSYPYGDVDSKTKAQVAQAGYRCAVGTRPGVSLWCDPFDLERIGISERDSNLDVALKLRYGESSWQAMRGRARSFASRIAGAARGALAHEFP